MNLDHIDRLLIDALPWLSVTLFPVLLILAAVFGTEAYRLGDENVHDVSDYAPTLAPERRDWPLNGRRRLRRQVPSATPIHDELAAEPMSDETAHRIARVWLEDIAADEQAKAGIHRYAADHWASRDGSCWSDCPACARDLVGAFPVVRAA